MFVRCSLCCCVVLYVFCVFMSVYVCVFVFLPVFVSFSVDQVLPGQLYMCLCDSLRLFELSHCFCVLFWCLFVFMCVFICCYVCLCVIVRVSGFVLVLCGNS